MGLVGYVVVGAFLLKEIQFIERLYNRFFLKFFTKLKYRKGDITMDAIIDRPDPEPVGPADPGPRTFVAGFYTQETGLRTLRNPETGNRCESIQVIHICGSGQTESGQVTFMLSDYTCFPPGVFNTRDVYFVATPRNASPVILTTQVESQLEDVKITVFAWTKEGNPFGRVNFDWHCCVQLQRGDGG